MDINVLHEYADEYLASLDDVKEQETWCTNRQIAKSIISDLLQCIENKEALFKAKQLLENNGYEVQRK